MKSFLALALMVAACGVKPEPPIIYIPVETYVDADGPWTRSSIDRIEWTPDTVTGVWATGPDSSACLEYWAQWSWRQDENGGSEGVVTAMQIKRVVKRYGWPPDWVSREEVLDCMDPGHEYH